MTHHVIAAMCALLLLATSIPCHAQAAETPASRSVDRANAGVVLYEAGKWEEALREFREAESLYHSPVYVLYAAKCLKSSGRLIEAKRDLAKLLAEEIADGAPDAWRQAQADGRAELGAIDRDIPTVVVEVSGASRAIRVTVDGRPLGLKQIVALDPGLHRFDAIDGTRRESRSVTLRPGEKSLRILLRLPARERRPKTVPDRGPNLPGLVLTVAGGTAIVAGGVVGIVALNKASDAKADFPESCNGSTCPISRKPEIESKTESARRLATVSDALFIGGGLMLAAGVVLLIVDPGAKPRVSASAASAGLRF